MTTRTTKTNRTKLESGRGCCVNLVASSSSGARKAVTRSSSGLRGPSHFHFTGNASLGPTRGWLAETMSIHYKRGRLVTPL